MSGHLVGEVIKASPKLRARGLSRNGFLALIAIAEKASNGDRRASVNWAHIQDGLYGASVNGASVKTARRAVKELEGLELIRVVSKGWANQHDGRSHAPVYEVCLWTPVSTSTNRIGTPVSTSTELDVDKSEVDVDKSEVDVDTRVPLTSDDISLDVYSDVSNDVTNDVEIARARDPKGTRLPDNWMPDPDVIDAMRDELRDSGKTVDLKAAHLVFTDYWIAQPGTKGRKANWNATWRNWMRREAQNANGTNGQRPHKLRVAAELAATMRAEEAEEPQKELTERNPHDWPGLP